MTETQTRDEFLQSCVQELRDGKIKPDDIKSSGTLSHSEKKFIAETFIAKSDRESDYNPFVDFQSEPIWKLSDPILTWGTEKADEKFSPIEPHQFLVLAGKQGSGKTQFTFFVAEKNAKKYPVDYISLEMSRDDIFTRAGIQAAGITKPEWRDKSLISEKKRNKYLARKSTLRETENLHLFGIGEVGAGTIEDICAVIKTSRPVLAVIDNLDLVSKTTQGMSEFDHHNHVTAYLLRFTSEEKIPVILLHHLRKTKDRDITAIRGSGKISDNADGVIMVRRYVQEHSPEDGDDFSAAEVCRTILTEQKGRVFGESTTNLEIYFDRGKFSDEFLGVKSGF